MKKESILYGIIGLLLGVVLMGFTATYAVNNEHQGMMRVMGVGDDKINSIADNSMGMDMMTESLKGKTGDEFDKLFISEMIVHHQGAIDMAKLTKDNAKHDEIKKLGDDIIAAQTKEISEMQQWQLLWGYPTDDDSMGGMHMGH